MIPGSPLAWLSSCSRKLPLRWAGHCTLYSLHSPCPVQAGGGETAPAAAEEDGGGGGDDKVEGAGVTVAAGNVTTAPAEPKNVTEETIESIVLPEVGSAAKEHSSSLAIFFLLFVLILCIFLIHVLLQVTLRHFPDFISYYVFY